MQITTEFYGKSEIWIYKLDANKVHGVTVKVSNN